MIMTVRVAGAEGIPALIAALPAAHRQQAMALAAALFVVGRPAEIDGMPASEVDMRIERGMARVGLVEVALPRLEF